MKTDLDAMLEGPFDLGRLRVIAGRLGVPQDTFSRLSAEKEVAALTEYLIELLDSLERQHMTIDQYVQIVDARTKSLTRFPVPPFGRRRGGLV